MPEFLKSAEAIFIAGLLPYFYTGWVIYIAIRRITGWERRTSRKRTAVLFLLLVHGIPLVFIFNRIMNAVLLGNSDYTLSSAAVLILVHTIFGAFIIATQAAVFHFVAAILLKVAGIWSRRRKSGVRIIWGWTTVGLVALSSIYVSSRSLYDATTVHIQHREYLIPELPDRLDGLRIGVFADTQGDDYTTSSRMREYIGYINAEKPDLILFAGDLATGTLEHRYVDSSASIMSGLHARLGTFCVVGDHDSYTGLTVIKKALVKRGLTVCGNDLQLLSVDGSWIELVFLTNIRNDPASSEKIDSLLGTLSNGSFSILLTHEVTGEIVEKANSAGVYLVVGGHTHGGQIRFWFFGVYLTASMLNSRFITGYYPLPGTLVYICSGLGMSIIPVRYNATPSVGIITLRKGKQ